ncbi:MAG: glycosyltransferase family 39 protein [Massilia sp.]
MLALGLYFLAQVAIRVMQDGALALDEAEQVFNAQQLLLGYGSQPPLYEWLQWAVFKLVGINHFGLSVLKNALLFALYASVFQAARLLLGPAAAAAAAASMVLIVPLGWEAQIDRTHSLVATAVAAGALWTYLALLRHPARWRYALLGLLLGLGMQSKYNFAIFVVGLTGASLLVREHRQLVWTRKAWITVLVAALSVLPHALWFLQQLDAATAETLDKMADHDPNAAYATQLANGFKHLFLGIASFITPLWIALAVAYRSPKHACLAAGTPEARFFLWLCAIGFASITAMILSGQLAHIKSRWLQPFLFVLPLGLFVVFPARREAVYRQLLAISGVAALAMLVALAMRPQVQSSRGQPTRLSRPYPELGAELARRFPGIPVIAVRDRYIAGNVRLQLPRTRVRLLREFCRQRLADGQRALVLVQEGMTGPGFSLDRCAAAAVLERGRIEAAAAARPDDKLGFDYALLAPAG